MGLFRHLLSLGYEDDPELLPAIERAVTIVEPRLKQTRKYPNAYRKPILSALKYAHNMALSVPGPVMADLESYAKDAYVHAIFPSMDVVSEAFRTSRAMQDYLHAHTSTAEIYALMGMRRHEKTMMGMELSGQVIHRDVPQHVIYFSSHTIENPASSETQAREQIAWAFFDSLVKQVTKRVALRKQEIESQQQEKDILMARLRASSAEERPAMEADLSGLLSRMQATTKALDLHNYLDDFKAVLLNPEQYLRLDQLSMNLDSMGILRNNDSEVQAQTISFNELVGFDRRDWIVTMVHCRDIQRETFAARLETAYRRLSI